MIPIPRLSYILVREVLCPVAPGDNCTRSTAERLARSPPVRFSEASRKKFAETPGYRQRILSLGQFSLLSLGSFRFIIHCRFIETLSGSQCAPTSRRGDLALWVHHFGLPQLVFPLFPLRPEQRWIPHLTKNPTSRTNLPNTGSFEEPSLIPPPGHLASDQCWTSVPKVSRVVLITIRE